MKKITCIQQLKIGKLYWFKAVVPLSKDSMYVFWLNFDMTPLDQYLVYLGHKGPLLNFLDAQGKVQCMSTFGLENHNEAGIQLCEVEHL